MTKQTRITGQAMAISFASSEPPARIELIPTGVLRLGDERGVVGKITDPAALIARSLSAAPGGVLPIDFDHGLDGLGTGSGQAAGWITGLEVEAGRIMASVEWTPAGAQALRDKSYRFISPTFFTPKGGGEVTHIARAGLTNNPAFGELKQLASQQEDDPMPQWLKDLAVVLGMPDETDETKIAAAASTAVAVARRAGQIVTAAGLTGDLDDTKVTAITAKITAAAAPDPAKFAPLSVVTELQGQVASLTTALTGDKVDRVIAAASEAGKLSPAMQDWAKGYAASDMAGFEKWLAAAPVIAPGGTLITSLQPKGVQGGLTAEEKQVCAATGVSEEAFLATKTGKKPETKTETKKDA